MRKNEINQGKRRDQAEQSREEDKH